MNAIATVCTLMLVGLLMLMAKRVIERSIKIHRIGERSNRIISYMMPIVDDDSLDLAS